MNHLFSPGLNPTLRRTLVLAGLLIPASFMVVFAASDSSKAADSWVAPPRAARKESPVAANSVSRAAGMELFVAACVPCHGTTGRGDGVAAAALEREGKSIRPGNLSDPKLREQSDGTLFWKISEGRTPMPAFQESLTEEQRWQIVTYVRTLAVPGGAATPPPQNNGIKP